MHQNCWILQHLTWALGDQHRSPGPLAVMGWCRDLSHLVTPIGIDYVLLLKIGASLLVWGYTYSIYLPLPEDDKWVEAKLCGWAMRINKPHPPVAVKLTVSLYKNNLYKNNLYYFTLLSACLVGRRGEQLEQLSLWNLNYLDLRQWSSHGGGPQPLSGPPLRFMHIRKFGDRGDHYKEY